MNRFREAFAIPPRPLYLNSANLSFCSREVLAAIARYQMEFESNPTAGLKSAWGRLWQVQKRLAGFLGAEPGSLFLRPNVTSVLNSLIFGLPLDPGDEILMGGLEYGAIINIARLRAEQQNLTVRLIRFPHRASEIERLDESAIAELILSQVGPKTKMLVISHVIGAYGLCVPIAPVAAFTRARGIRLVVDGAYAVGAIPVDFSELSQVDGYGCSLYKWLTGPKGTAFGWVAPRWHESLVATTAGWTTFETEGPFAAFGEGHRFASRFSLAGCHDFAPFFAIDDLLAVWERSDVKLITKQRVTLVEQLFTRLEKADWECLRPPQLPPLVTARPRNPRAPLPADLSERLLKNHDLQANAVCLGDRWHVTLSPHAYNTEAEIEEAMERLMKFTTE